MKKIVYFDLGAYTGDTIRAFMDEIDPAAKCLIYAFEPNPNFTKLLATDVKRLVESRGYSYHFSPSAAWDEFGFKKFAIDKSDTPMGSTLFESKAQWKEGIKVEVLTMDFSRVLADLFGEKPADMHIIVKMDIEGAEFRVLEKMIADGTDQLVDELIVEMHPNRVPEYTTTYSKELLSRLRCGRIKEMRT